MPFKTLTYDVFHLGLYLAAALAWTALCVLVLLNARRRMPYTSGAGSLWTGAVGAIICLGFLLADVLRLVSESVVLFGVLVFGVITPGVIATVLWVYLYVRRGTLPEKSL
ncbi:hypothetical protein [Pseudomonas putida]|uniref:hypothetical protein n=1 Tax=Pseudomonas putida TaxID=303 RepID=UPI002366034E|nr:hypothetical protein [Pseudomonas putida]MDD2049720.1 hypothetical protein [Pseudomonas putida]